MKKNLLLALALMSLGTLRAEVKLPSVFSDNMILQQKTQAPIWGTTTKGKTTIEVTTSWDNKTVKTKADKDGSWRLSVETPSYGGPYTVTVSDGEALVLENVLIGEIWITSGQSNMEMTMGGFTNQPVYGSNRDVALSADSELRIMKIERSSAAEPSMDIKSSGWKQASPDVVANTSATAYYFARMMREVLGVPVGLLCTSWGGTSIDCWIDAATAAKYPDIARRDVKRDPAEFRHSSAIFNAMIYPIAGFAAQGFLWYQGESDRPMYQNYKEKFVDMVALWRGMWNRGDMPFYYAQIAPYNYTRYRKEEDNTPFIREHQLEALKEIPNSGMACLSDVGTENLIHPGRKQFAGERLAYQALNKTYGIKSIVADGPVYESMTIEGDKIILKFKNTDGGLYTFGKELNDFEIAGENGFFVPAAAVILDRSSVAVSSSEVKEPKHVRYGFHGWFDGGLYNGAQLPASSFRTGE